MGTFFCQFLTIMFVAAKLAGLVSWSWWVVFSPSLIAIALTVLLLLCEFVVEIVYKNR